MKFTKENNQIKLEMSIDKWEQLLFYMGLAIGSISKDKELFYQGLQFINEINEGNPDFDRYSVPKQYNAQKEKE